MGIIHDCLDPSWFSHFLHLIDSWSIMLYPWCCHGDMSEYGGYRIVAPASYGAKRVASLGRFANLSSLMFTYFWEWVENSLNLNGYLLLPHNQQSDI
jgi:hypothetical protein